MKREKKLTKKQRKTLAGPASPAASQAHIHCVSCGRHIDPPEMTQGRSNWVRCAHGTKYAACGGCVPDAMTRLAEHDRTGKPVTAAAVWH